MTMIEKGNEIEEEKEGEMVDDWSHQHPLTLVETSGSDPSCGCQGQFSKLHEECAGPPRKIRLEMHPHHILTQDFDRDNWQTRCSICQLRVGEIFYRCMSTECMFRTHISCVKGSEMMHAAEDDEQCRTEIINHPSHPEHELKLLRRLCTFKCDACGTTCFGSSYRCTTDGCQYWIHEICASFPPNIKREDHNHTLSLSYHVPQKYIRFSYSCEVCRKTLVPKYWIYHCDLCSYAVHLRCALRKSPPATREKGIMEFPINDVGEDLIGGFVRRQGVETPIPHQDVDYEFHHHKLTLVSSSQEEEKNEEDKSELICDGCITPIFSGSSSKEYYYMRCSIRSCKYYLHLACFRLPTQLSSLPLIHDHDHKLVLQSGDKLKPWESSSCSVCDKETNGLYYVCTECDEFKVDIKCASMPDTIYHAAHPQHPLKLLSKEGTRKRGYHSCDAGCDSLSSGINSYACGSCDFIVHLGCVGMPASTTSSKHPLLPLTYDANLNHPGDLYCDQCKTQMNPKSWMYHCRNWDLSFHPKCLETSGSVTNM